MTKENGKAAIHPSRNLQERKGPPFDRLFPFSNNGKKAEMVRQTETVLRLAGPDLISNSPDKLQLLAHILVLERVTLGVRSKTTLRRNTHTLQSLLSRLPTALGNEISSLVHSLYHLLLVLQLRELASNNTQDNILVLGQMLQRLETSCARGIVLEVISIHIQILEEFGGNVIVSAL
jgi:hypothetical protein